ncbi:LuxR C-terminal-related transcriptional regulator [Nocardia jiangxiensis]|uniref:LuxR C-terminal-related transcriptional regulator n=1 Tax=Nocardia jiangxiensis TaxID=282685 RepID=A0ABW6S8T2_9NOCA
MPHASWASAVIAEPVVEQVKDIFLQAREVLGNTYETDTSLPDDACLTTVRRRVEEFVTSDDISAARRAEACELLATIHTLQQAELESSLAQQLSKLTEVRTCIDELSGLSPRELIDTVPLRICRNMSVGRAMISTISGSVWLPQQLHIEERTAGSAEFEEFVDGARIPLSDAPLETELLVRRRTVALVPDPMSDKRTYKQIVDAARTQAYVAAPITLRGRTIGMLHADRPEDPNSLCHDDLDWLAMFSECLSTIFESALLQQRIEQQLRRATDTYAQVVALLGQVETVAAETGQSIPQPLRPRGIEQRTLSGAAALTSREREVLAHLSTGATNVQIARNLVVSEATVKSHLKQISRKLGTSSRAAAVAAYARMTQGNLGFAP